MPRLHRLCLHSLSLWPLSETRRKGARTFANALSLTGSSTLAGTSDLTFTGNFNLVGTTRTPTNIFSTTVSGVIVNPWWEIPTSIANESVAAMVRNNPRAAAARGYVFEQGRYRQRPGPGNSLGQMKLVMPNDHAIFLHDTPSRGLFANPARAYSHGCVRVNQALDFVTALLRVRAGWDRAATDAAVATGRTETLTLPEPIPVYISYFTVAPFTAADGSNPLRHYADIYGHDRAGR